MSSDMISVSDLKS